MFTEGKWIVTKWSSHKHVHISSDINEGKYGSLMFIADCGNLNKEDGLPYNPDVEGNAKLISKSPILYETLKAIVDCYGLGLSAEQFVNQIDDFINEGKQVIAEIEGR